MATTPSELMVIDYWNLVRQAVEENGPDLDPDDVAELLAIAGKSAADFEADCQLLEQRIGWFQKIEEGAQARQEAQALEQRIAEIECEMLRLKTELIDVRCARGTAWARASNVKRGENWLRTHPPSWLQERIDENMRERRQLMLEIQELKRKLHYLEASEVRPGQTTRQQIQAAIEAAEKRQLVLASELEALSGLATSELWGTPPAA